MEKVSMNFVLVLFLIPACVAVLRISEVSGPSAVQNGSSSKLVLDCVFSAEEDDLKGLVVKWYFNDRPFPVYQWIPGNEPQDLGILKGRLDLSYKATSEAWGMHRAIAIRNPTLELSGEYSCSVSSFRAEDYKKKNLVVYVPASEAVLSYRKPSVGSILVTCHAEGIFPEPELFVYKSRPYLDRTHRHAISTSDVSKQVVSEGKSFNVTAKVVLFDFELRGETIFTCEISIPGTNYQIQKELFYTPGQPQHQKSILSGGEPMKRSNFTLLALALTVLLTLQTL